MASILTEPLAANHRVLPETASRMAHADLRKAEKPDLQAAIGGCVRAARQSLGWSLKEFAAAVDRDARQVSRWEDGTERAQFDVLWAVEALRGPLVIALAGLSEQIEINTTIQIRRVS
jgi:ribosome-binding protein aMBF1 (putative translation factor)